MTKKTDSQERSQIILYQTEDGKMKVQVKMDGETVWLSQKQMGALFDCSSDNIGLHLKNIFKSSELTEKSVTEDFSVTANDGKTYQVKHYNLDAIISVGYRVNSLRGTQFRIWATQRLREYIVKGFTLDDERLKQGGHKSRFFEELLERIRDIRSSERMLYQKVTDIYATSIDYRKDAKETDKFFKTVQNKMHFAVSGKTAAELIAERVDSKKPLVGLTNFSGLRLIQRDIYIAKNYLNETELEMLNRIVDAYLSFAEIQAKSEHAMTMKDWISKLDEYLTLLGKGVLMNAGSVSAEAAGEKALKEYEKYRQEQDKKYISDFDREVKKLTDKPTKPRKK
ncbi:MAG: virulence RhuM family protein [Deltaproteobacteria bacterium]|nr:virulence RhuM family protein [Deltaproteobacteria bacterium]